MWIKDLYECATEDYPNWDEAMYKAASASKEAHEMLFTLFKNEKNEFAKREGARILAKLKDFRVAPFLKEIALSHKDEEAQGEAALALIDLEDKNVINIFSSIIQNFKIADFVIKPLIDHPSPLSKKILNHLIASNSYINEAFGKWFIKK